MNFDVEDNDSGKKKKSTKPNLMFYLSIFFAVLAVILVIVYMRF